MSACCTPHLTVTQQRNRLGRCFSKSVFAATNAIESLHSQVKEHSKQELLPQL